MRKLGEHIMEIIVLASIILLFLSLFSIDKKNSKTEISLQNEIEEKAFFEHLYKNSVLSGSKIIVLDYVESKEDDKFAYYNREYIVQGLDGRASTRYLYKSKYNHNKKSRSVEIYNLTKKEDMQLQIVDR
jgi:hypothetical protein